MLSSKICFSDGLISGDQVIYNSGKELIQSNDFYILIERFCNIISVKDAQFDLFLNKYFNDEGYVDVWRIPHILIDIHQGNLKFLSKTLEDDEFLSIFPRFLGLFYNYCLSEYKPYLVDDLNLCDLQRTVLEIKVKQQVMNIAMDTYSRILENLKLYK